MTKLTPEQEVNIIAMREAGYTHSVIANKNGCSIATVKRACSRHGASKGSITDQLIAETRARLRQSIGGDDSIREIAASAVQDTQYHFELLREKLADAAEKLEINTPDDAKAAFKSLNSYANALKLSADAMRSALKIDTSESYEDNELPVLVVQAMTQQDVDELRRAQAEEEAELYGYDIEEEEEMTETILTH